MDDKEQLKNNFKTAIVQIDVTQARNERLQKRADELEKENKRLRETYENTGSYMNATYQKHRIEELEQQNKRYKQALEEIRKLTIYDDGTEEQVYIISDDALNQ